MTRGHTSLVGVGAIIEAHTGYIIDGFTSCKYCSACSYWDSRAKQDTTPSFKAKYHKWKNNHVCSKNFSETSGKMESSAAVKLWGMSMEYKLRYVVFVGDGDSAAHKAVCSMNNGNGPYGPNYPVVKEECLNHVSKRLGTRLRGLKKKLAEPVQTKSGKVTMKSKLGGIGKLTDNVINNLARYYGATVRRFVKRGGDRSRVNELQ